MPTKIIFTCGREPEYPRNALIRKALSDNFEVCEVTDQSHWVFLRYIRLFLNLYKATRSDHDLVFIGFHGYILVFLTRLLTKKPIILDAFTSIYDTFCFDRKIFSPNSLLGKFTYWLDKRSAELSDLVCVDTLAHALYYHNTFKIPDSKLKVFFVGADEAIFSPNPSNTTKPIVLFYGNYLPLHGVPIIIKASKIVESETNVHFKLLGKGHDFTVAQKLVSDLGIKNIEFLPPIPLKSLPEFINQGMICLGGHFGSSDKAARVIAGKTFQCLAMGKPTIVGENSANHELLTHGYDAWFCEMNNPEALAQAILALLNDDGLREKLGRNARQTFLQKGSYAKISPQISQLVIDLLKSTTSR